MFRVVWMPSAEADLAALWNDGGGWRGDLVEASEYVDRSLRRPTARGLGLPDRGVTRIWVCEPVVVTFELVLDDMRIEVLHLRWYEPGN